MSVPTYVGTVNKFWFEYSQSSSKDRSVFFIIPHGILNLILLTAYLALPERPSALTRIAIFLLISTLTLSSLHTDRSLILTYGVLIGIGDFCCLVLSVNMLFLYDSARDFKRRVSSINHPGKGSHDTMTTSQEMEHWEDIPRPLLERLYWAVDLIASLRALHWCYGHSSAALYRPSNSPDKRSTSSLLQSLCKFLFICCCVDFCKEIIAQDPYFWGYIDQNPPSYILNISQSTHFIQAYRMLVAFAVVFLTVEFLCTVGYLLCVNILGPSIVGSWGHDWAHRPPFGNLNAISKRGLQGFWGSWWHQWFRIIVTSPANAAINLLQIPQDSAVAAKSIRIVTAFVLSGVMHACGSQTLWGPSRPIDSFLFFALQPVGIAVQVSSSWVLDRLGVSSRISVRVRQAANVIFTGVWLLKTFPLMADDYAKGGLFLTELCPISLIQMLGFGGKARPRSPWNSFAMHEQGL